MGPVMSIMSDVDEDPDIVRDLCYHVRSCCNLRAVRHQARATVLNGGGVGVGIKGDAVQCSMNDLHRVTAMLDDGEDVNSQVRLCALSVSSDRARPLTAAAGGAQRAAMRCATNVTASAVFST